MIKYLNNLSKKQLYQLSQIWLDTNISAHNFIDESYYKKNQNSVEQAFDNAKIYACFEDNNIVGFAGMIDNYLAGLFVLQAYQNNGYGYLLLNELKTKYDTIILDVYAKNNKAMKFYLKNKFVIVDRKINPDTLELEFTMIWQKI